MTCPDCTVETPCPYYCPIHETHHVVPGMVDFCVEKATTPDARS